MNVHIWNKLIADNFFKILLCKSIKLLVFIDAQGPFYKGKKGIFGPFLSGGGGGGGGGDL